MKDSVFFYFGIFHFRRTSDFNLVFFLFLYAQLLGYCKQFILILGQVTEKRSAVNILSMSSGSRISQRGRGMPIYCLSKFSRNFHKNESVHAEDATPPPPIHQSSSLLASNSSGRAHTRYTTGYFLFVLLIYINCSLGALKCK